jgi:hypothetical protein
MFELFSSKINGQRSIILEIQSGLVRGAAIIQQENQTILVTSLVTRSISNKTIIEDSEHLSKRMIALVSEVVENLIADIGKEKIDRIEYILSSPWVFSTLKNIKLNYEKEVALDASSLDQIIKDTIKSYESVEDVRVIEQKVFEVRLNGYPVKSIENKKVHNFDISIANSLSSVNFLSNLDKTVKKYVNCRNVTLYSGVLLQYSALKNILVERNDFMYIHVHSKITELVVVKDGLCKHIASLPFGIETLVRNVSSITNKTVEASDSNLSMYEGAKLSEVEQNSMKEIVDPIINQWTTLIFDSFKDIFDITNIPKCVLLSTYSHFDLFKNALIIENNFKFDVISYDSIEAGNSILFQKGIPQSNMMKIYIEALNEKM